MAAGTPGRAGMRFERGGSMGRTMSWKPAILVLLLAASACSRPQPTGAEAGPAPRPSRPPAEPEWPAPSDSPPAGLACDAMTAPQCLLAKGCVLEAVPRGDPGYVCRAAKGPCEGGVSQFPALAFKAHCEGLPGCRYVPAQCFCPSAQTRVRSKSQVAISCVCGGGPPHRCEALADR